MPARFDGNSNLPSLCLLFLFFSPAPLTIYLFLSLGTGITVASKHFRCSSSGRLGAHHSGRLEHIYGHLKGSCFNPSLFLLLFALPSLIPSFLSLFIAHPYLLADIFMPEPASQTSVDGQVDHYRTTSRPPSHYGIIPQPTTWNWMDWMFHTGHVSSSISLFCFHCCLAFYFLLRGLALLQKSSIFDR